MLQLFNDYKNSGRLFEALLVGRNAFNRDPSNADIFDAYYSYLCSLAESLPSYDDRTRFAEQANVALAFFSENADLSEAVVERIQTYQERIDTIYRALSDYQRETLESQQQQIAQQNSDALKQLYLLKDKLQGSTTQEEFDAALVEISKIDVNIIKENLSEEQRIAYDSLTKDHTDLISQKMRELEYKKNVVYNKKAADAFEKAFKSFRADEGKYKKQTQLFALVSSTLFAFDASRLFNETLIYYNHVYSYIFSRLDDDGKFALTRYSIECERKLR